MKTASWLSVSWLALKILFYVTVTMQSAEIIVVAYQQF